ncbi:TspO/MBR family protein [Galbibacter sp.]|uniref:TspO/MBR family protein n=1 Tax=Galbibacter sp. TaxID=2918471 RepID=UPI003A8DCC52
MSKSLTKIVLSILVCLFVGMLCAVATQSTIAQWHTNFNQPVFQLSSTVFIGLWIVLDIVIGISAGIVWTKGFYHKWVKTALYHFGFQLLFSALWYMLLFGFHKPLWAYVIILVQFILILLTYKWFRVVNHLAAYLLIPYIIWVCYLAVYTFYVWQLN